MKKYIKKISFLLAAVAVLISSFFLLHKTPGDVEIIVNHASADIPSASDGDSGAAADGGCGVGGVGCGPGM